MLDRSGRYCEVSLPVPVDHPFTYEIPESVSRLQAGCRVVVPFAGRKLTGVVVEVHQREATGPVREILSVLDREPALDHDLIRLARWIADYYCAPLGEVLRGMLPLSADVRRTERFTLTDLGYEIVAQLSTTAKAGDTALQILAALERRPVSASYLTTRFPSAKATLTALEKKGWVTSEREIAARDPLRAPAARLSATFLRRPDDTTKLRKAERELLAFLELHPGQHNLAELAANLSNASEAGRSLARRELIVLEPEASQIGTALPRPTPVLNPFQQQAFAEIQAALNIEQFKAFLLQGVTGSGKTEVYLHAIEACLALGKGSLLLVPEIALTPAVAGHFLHRFGSEAAILHSAFGEAERADQWRRIRDGRARVVVGTRSGVFAPVQNLGLVIVDEEHDGSYKQQESPRYHGRDVALMRAKESNAVAILGSATPSIESRHNANQSKYQLLLLPERVNQRPMPKVEIVDMRSEFLETKRQATFSRKLLEQMERRLQQGEQTMLLLNRRGFSSFMMCRECGERLHCTNCSVVLTYHKRDRRMLCHYCGYAEKVPTECPKCGSDYIQFLGTGSERVEEELHDFLPTARIGRLDRDSVSGKGTFEQILQSFRDGDLDILVGTQMIAKGHDIPNVTLVGIVLADLGLGLPDFRAAERTFQLLTQAAGRAGRGEIPGEVIVQAINPDHYAIQLAAQQDYETFFKKEWEFRKWLRYPPLAAFANVVVRAQKQEDALRMATELGYLLKPSPEGIRVMGPAEAPVPRLKDEFRYQILLKAVKRVTLRDTLKQLQTFAVKERWSATTLVIDVDPISLM